MADGTIFISIVCCIFAAFTFYFVWISLRESDRVFLTAWFRTSLYFAVMRLCSRTVRPAVTRLIEAIDRDPSKWRFRHADILLNSTRIASGGVSISINSRCVTAPFNLSLRPCEWKLLMPKIEFLREYWIMRETDAPEVRVIEALRDDEDDPDDCPF